MNDYSRYSRQTELIGVEGQDALKKARVLCVGAGGLGSLVSSYLVGAGVGVIGIADGDIIELSNLTRQINYNEMHCGQYKVVVLESILKQLNSNCIINMHNNFLDYSNAEDILALYDVIVDCSDNFKTRYLISDICSNSLTPLIGASVDGFMGQVMVFCGECCYRCLFPNVNSAISCINGDVIGPAVGIIAGIQANEVLKFISGLNKSSYLIQVDSLVNQMSCHKIVTDHNCINNHSDVLAGDSIVSRLEFSQVLTLSASGEVQIIDIRNKPTKNLGFSIFEVINIDQNDITSISKYLPKNQAVVIICDYGYRSRLVALRLAQVGYSQVYFSSVLW